MHLRVESESGEFLCDLDLSSLDVRRMIMYAIEKLKTDKKKKIEYSIPLNKSDAIKLIEYAVISMLDDEIQKEKDK